MKNEFKATVNFKFDGIEFKVNKFLTESEVTSGNITEIVEALRIEANNDIAAIPSDYTFEVTVRDTCCKVEIPINQWKKENVIRCSCGHDFVSNEHTIYYSDDLDQLYHVCPKCEEFHD